MRGRGGGAAAPARGRVAAGAIRTVYEDFRPVSEWKQDDESHILSIYLPGFTKEQIRVSTEGRNTIRVRGERLVAGNKWSRFLEDFQVPENSEMNSVHAKFQVGVLNVTVLKNVPNRPQETTLPPKTPTVITQKQPTPQKSQDKATPQANTSQSTHDKSSEPQKAIDTQIQKVKDVFTPLGKVPQRVADVVQKTVDEEKKIWEGIIRSPEDDTVEKAKLAKNGPGNTEKDKKLEGKEENQSSVADYGAFTNEKYKNAMRGMGEINEDRQLLVNMGVGVLVIMALSAYVAYSYASGKK